MTFRRDLATLFPSRTPPRVAHHRIKAYQEAVTALGTAKAVRDKAYIPGTLDIFRVSDNHKYVKATDFEEIAPGGYRNLTIAANTQVKIEYLLDIDNMNLPVVAQEEAPTTPTAPTAPAASPPPQSLNFATDPAPLTPGSNVYWAGVFVPLTPDLQVVGMVIRNTTTGASYTMRIRPSNENAINTPGTVIASKDFTGNGGPMRVLFDTPSPLPCVHSPWSSRSPSHSPPPRSARAACSSRSNRWRLLPSRHCPQAMNIQRGPSWPPFSFVATGPDKASADEIPRRSQGIPQVR